MKKIYTLIITLLGSYVISVAQPITADFQASSVRCTGKPVYFSNYSWDSLSSPLSARWFFGDGDSSNLWNPSHLYSSGSFDVTLIVTDTFNNADTAVWTALYVDTFCPPTANFNTYLQKCDSNKIIFNGVWNGPHPVIMWTWKFGDGSPDTSGASLQYNVPHYYVSTGSYEATLVFQDTTGAIDSVKNWVYANPCPPIANFNFDMGKCVGENISFYGYENTMGTIASWSWDFGDGNTATGQYPSHAFAYADTFNVRLIAQDTSGTIDTVYNYVYVLCAPQPLNSSINVNGNGCKNDSMIIYSNAWGGISPYSFKWYFGDGDSSSLSNPYHTYADSGYKNITLIVTDNVGAKDTSTYVLYVQDTCLPPPIAGFNFDMGKCAGENINFYGYENLPGTVVSWSWNFGDGNVGSGKNTNHTYAYSDTFNVVLVAQDTSGTIDTIFQQVMICAPQPLQANIGSQSNGCKNDSVMFNDYSYGGKMPYNYQWNFGDSTTSTSNNPYHTYTTSGNKNVMLIVVDNLGAIDTAYWNIYIEDTCMPPPIAGFNSNGGCIGDTIYFNGYPNATQIVSWNWDFGDGNYGSGQYTSHVYAYADTFNVLLIAQDTAGTIDSIYNYQYICAPTPLNASIGAPSNGCKNDTVYFNDYSWGGKMPYTHSWNFGDGNMSTQKSPIHTYADSGSYNVVLVVTDNEGTKDTAYWSIYIQDSCVNPPLDVMIMTNSNGCKNDTIQFNQNTGGGNPPYSWTWSFGDGGTSTVGTTWHAYADSGSYNVMLVVTDNLGATDTAYWNIYIQDSCAPPVAADFNWNTPCANDTTQFYAWQSGPDGILSWNWNFGDGGSASTQNTNHIYASAGNYNVCLIVSTTKGNDTICKNVQIDSCGGAGMTADFNWSDHCINDTTQFNAWPTSPDSVFAWNWIFGDGGTASTQNANHTYLTAGNYNVCLLATTIKGTDTICKNVFIDSCGAGGTMDFSWNSTCLDSVIQFTDQTTYQGISTWSWNFGDSVVSTLQNPTHTYATAGLKNVTLIVSDSLMTGSDTLTKQIYIAACASPCTTNVDAGVDTSICLGGSVYLTASSGALGYTWSSGDSTQSTLVTPTTTTTYTVEAYYGGSCYSADTVRVTVNSAVTADAGTDQSICPGGSASLNATGGTTFSWTPSTGLSSTTVANPTATPTTTTNYIVTVSNGSGCSDVDTITVTVNAAVTADAGTDQSICSGASASLNATGGTSFSWTPSTGLSSTTVANPTASPTTTTNYIVTVSNASGCSDVDTVTVTVNSAVTADAGTDQSICPGGSASLNATGGTTFSWTPSTGLSSTTVANPTATPTTTTNYIVTVSNASGCSDVDTVTVTVNSAVTANAGTDQSICPGGSASLNATGGSSYMWSPTTGLDAPDVANPNASSTTTTNYIVTVTDANGCVGTDTVTVTVNSAVTADAGTDQSICPGGSASLNATGGASFSWSPTTGLDAPDVANPNASPTSTTIYTVTVIDANGCVGIDSITITVNSAVTADAGTDQSICPGASASLNATGGTTFSWSPSTGLSSTTIANPTATPTVTTNYIVTVSNGSGCSDVDTLTITVFAAPSVSAGTDQSFCPGGSAALNATGAASYSWSPATGLSDDLIANPVATPTSSTTYTVTGTDANGCTGTDAVTVTVNAGVSVSTTFNNTTCGNTNGDATASVTGGTAPYSYLWSPGAQTVATATGLSATSYSVLVTDANGCKDSSQVNIGNADGPSVTNLFTNDASCPSACNGSSTVTVSGGTTPYTYSWNTTPAGTAASVTSLCPGSYTVTVTDANSCSVNATAVIIATGNDPSLSGVVKINSVPITSGVVEVYLTGGSGALEVAGTTNVNASGVYSFPAIAQGDYIISAMPDTNIYPYAVKTYYSFKHKWLEADTIASPCGASNVIDLDVIDLTPMNGNATVSGVIKNVTGGKARAAGDPIPGVDIFLEQNPGGNVVAQSVTDTAGKFTFNDVEVGDYSIFVDIPGLGVVETYSIEVTPTDSVFEEKDFYIDSVSGTIDTLDPDIQSVMKKIRLNSGLSAYPNPWNDQTSIFMSLGSTSQVAVEVYNILGENVAVLTRGTRNAGVYKFSLTSRELNGQTGVYFVKLTVNGETVKTIKMILTQ